MNESINDGLSGGLDSLVWDGARDIEFTWADGVAMGVSAILVF